MFALGVRARLPLACLIPLGCLTAAGAPQRDWDTQASPVRSKLEHARQVNLEYVANMPNFVADETAKRYTGDKGSSRWHDLDTIETEITFKGSQAVRTQIRRNGKPWKQPFKALPDFKWYGGFGTELKSLFDPECPTKIEYGGHAEVRGKQLLKYRFSSPADGCFALFYAGSQQYNPARTGHAFVEESSGKVIQFDEDATGFPEDFPFDEREEQVSWDYVKIGDDTHLLPVAANFLVKHSSGQRSKIEVEYKNHRHFESSTNITFR